MAEVLHRIVDAHGIGKLARIHPIVRIPERLEFAEGLDELGAKHFGEKRGARLAVAVFAGERTAERENDLGSAFDEFAKTANAFGAAEVEIYAHVNAALAVVAVERTAEAILAHEPGDGAEIFPELRGRNGGILPPLPTVGLARNKHHGAERRLAHMPHCPSFIGRANVSYGRRVPGLRRADQRF